MPRTGIVSIIGIGTLALFSGVITVGFLDQLRIIREQAPQSRGTVTVAASANGKGSGSIETHGVIAMAVLEKERRVSSSAASLDETCPCCGRPMQAAGQEAALRA